MGRNGSDGGEKKFISKTEEQSQRSNSKWTSLLTSTFTPQLNKGKADLVRFLWKTSRELNKTIQVTIAKLPMSFPCLSFYFQAKRSQSLLLYYQMKSSLLWLKLCWATSQCANREKGLACSILTPSPVQLLVHTIKTIIYRHFIVMRRVW